MVRLAIQDPDVCTRFETLFGGSVLQQSRRQPHHRDIWLWTASSAQLAARVMVAVYPFMLGRRQARIAELVRDYRPYALEQDATLRHRLELQREARRLQATGLYPTEIGRRLCITRHQVCYYLQAELKSDAHVVPPTTFASVALTTEVLEAWWVGIMEAEGSFRVAKGTRKTPISAWSTDRDVLDRITSITPGRISSRRPQRLNHKTAWRWEMSGDASRKDALLRGLLLRFSERRQAQIRSCLQAYEAIAHETTLRQARHRHILDLYDAGNSFAAIAEDINLSSEAVRQVVRKVHPSTRRSPTSPADLERLLPDVRRLRREGVTREEIAITLDMSVSAVARILSPTFACPDPTDLER